MVARPCSSLLTVSLLILLIRVIFFYSISPGITPLQVLILITCFLLDGLFVTRLRRILMFDASLHLNTVVRLLQLGLGSLCLVSLVVLLLLFQASARDFRIISASTCVIESICVPESTPSHVGGRGFGEIKVISHTLPVDADDGVDFGHLPDDCQEKLVVVLD
ncbi:hypothetical protein DL98DRAFT_48704 [Cadophora sp. DSE1049]|nr:hypothetical protein DL98DRAFT_48704 [Cadophora sp. DSE1049]